MKELMTCTPMSLPAERQVEAAMAARDENPANNPPLHMLMALESDFNPTPDKIAVVTTKYWRGGNTKFPVGFMDNPPKDLRAKILLHMNAWGKTANVAFVESATEPKVRISRGTGGFWSYLGTDILLIDKAKQTMNLEGFTMNTADSEFYRVVRHETGHTLGCPHEHMRAELVALIDPAKAIAYFGQTQGWTPDQVRQQVLTPLEAGSLLGTDRPDMNSIMCYQIPGALTKDGKPIVGGTDIDPTDYAFMGKVYPKPASGLADISAAAAPGYAFHGGRACPDCIEIELRNGSRLSVPPEASGLQLRTVLDALDDAGHATVD